MRISDWSSDVCSSDLLDKATERTQVLNRAPDPAGVPARRAALRLLDAVTRRGQPLESALAGATADLGNPADRGISHAPAATVPRWHPDLACLVGHATKHPPPPAYLATMSPSTAPP